MKLNKLHLLLFAFIISLLGCKDDDDSSARIFERDRAEVYAEDLVEIENFLKTHKYVSGFDFNTIYNNPQNDNYTLNFIELSPNDTEAESLFGLLNQNSTATANVLKYKMVTDKAGVEYKLYYLVIREGLGETLHPLDQAVTRFDGTSIKFNDDGNEIESNTFDSSPLPIAFNLTSIGTISGVVQGFRDGLVEFKTSNGFSEDQNGEITYENHGIGALFVPSGLGYFSQTIGSLSPYSPVIFKINLLGRIDTDYDLDNIPSYLEDLNADGNGFNEDSDNDNIANFFDNDDDNDGVLTRDEDLEDTDLNVDSDGDGDPTNDKNGDGNPLNDDTDGDGVPNYLDANTTISRD